jgi:hypothetical protein
VNDEHTLHIEPDTPKETTDVGEREKQADEDEAVRDEWWEIEEAGDASSDFIVTGDYPEAGNIVCLSPDFDSTESLLLWPARARRIIACVNACRGISTENLEAYGAEQNEAMRFLMLESEAHARRCDVSDRPNPKTEPDQS